MSHFGREPYQPPRWLALVVVGAAVAGVAFAIWLFGVMT
jgi:hypothetical protein